MRPLPSFDYPGLLVQKHIHNTKMEISSKFVGVSLKEHRTVIDWRHTMNYAAAVDDNNPHYFDDERESGIVAPPMYSVAVTWPILEKLWQYIDVDDFPLEILRTQVHYTEYLEFHALLKPGDEIRVHGSIIAILPTRAGTYLVIRFQAMNAEGRAMFTEYVGGMMRGVACVDGGAGAESLPQIPSPPKTATPLWEKTIPVEPLRPYIYDGCTNITFPIHTSRKFAHEVGLPDILLQGTAALAFAARELTNRNGNGDPGRLQALACRFTGMIFPGAEIKIQLLHSQERKKHQDLFFRILGDRGQSVINQGYAKMRSS